MLDTITSTPRISRDDWGRHIRCDKCPAAAHVLAWKIIDHSMYELVFCMHHGGRYFDQLTVQGFTIEHDPLPDDKEIAKLTEND